MALKLYTAPAIPNPDVVKMYLQETGRQYMVENINLNVGKKRTVVIKILIH